MQNFANEFRKTASPLFGLQWMSHRRLDHDLTLWPNLPIGSRPLCLSMSNNWMKDWHPSCNNPLLALNGNGSVLDRCQFIVWSKSQVQWPVTLEAGAWLNVMSLLSITPLSWTRLYRLANYNVVSYYTNFGFQYQSKYVLLLWASWFSFNNNQIYVTRHEEFE